MKHMHPSSAALASAVLTLLLAGCAELGDREVRSALEESFGDTGVCWALENMENVSFPIRTGFDPTATQGNAILGGLRSLGFIRVRPIETSGNRFGFFSQPGMEVSLTPEGERAGVWDREKGFCLGNKRVTEVVRFSEPADHMGARISQVEYRWAIEDTPAWADATAFREVRGFAGPVEANAVLRKDNDGWRVLE